MLKFRYLFNNPDLAEMLVKNWEYDPDSLELFKYFRISANAVYPFRLAGETCFLRFSPVVEKDENTLIAELDFLNYLHKKGYPAVEPLHTKEGQLYVLKDTPWGEYLACVFRKVAGKQINQTSFEDELMFAYGSALGDLHALLRKYEPRIARRWSHMDVLNWIESEFSRISPDPKIMDELNDLREQLSRLPMNGSVYGLIHFDFEPDNVFFDESNYHCSVIDFDDAMYHWYVMDIVQALAAIKDELEQEDISEKRSHFLEGYRSKFTINDQLLSMETLFQRFANLYQFTRVTSAMQEHWDNEPDWMVSLRKHLSDQLIRQAATL